ncbi:holo-ACP synthase [Ruminococcaceae bacterium OttesenSCG-928-D13]|nr:holo-ACP synthase [Ruminococcaceae bacterium OttesenSCG-928-D13]
MIYGVGVDCVQVARIAKSMEKPRFAERVFSEAERALFEQIGAEAKRDETAAANFAAKEAFLKACGVGLGGFALSEIAALRRESGAPYYQLSGAALAFCEENGLAAHLSLTHEGGMAVAFAVLEKG